MKTDSMIRRRGLLRAGLLPLLIALCADPAAGQSFSGNLDPNPPIDGDNLTVFDGQVFFSDSDTFTSQNVYFGLDGFGGPNEALIDGDGALWTITESFYVAGDDIMESDNPGAHPVNNPTAELEIRRGTLQIADTLVIWPEAHVIIEGAAVDEAALIVDSIAFPETVFGGPGNPQGVLTMRGGLLQLTGVNPGTFRNGFFNNRWTGGTVHITNAPVLLDDTFNGGMFGSVLDLDNPGGGPAPKTLILDQTLFLNQGSLNVNGGTLELNGQANGSSDYVVNGGRINLNSGTLTMSQQITIGTGGLMGANETWNSGATLNLANDLTIAPDGDLTNDGTANVHHVAVQGGGVFNNAGTLNAQNIDVQAGGTLGNTGTINAQDLSVGSGATFDHSGTASFGTIDIDAGGTITTTGGSLTGTDLSLTGLNAILLVQDGLVDVDTVDVAAGADIMVSGGAALKTGTLTAVDPGSVNVNFGSLTMVDNLLLSDSSIFAGGADQTFGEGRQLRVLDTAVSSGLGEALGPGWRSAHHWRPRRGRRRAAPVWGQPLAL